MRVTDWRGHSVALECEPWDFLQRLIESFSHESAPESAPDAAPLLIGAFGYEAGLRLEGIQPIDSDQHPVPEIALNIYPWALEWNHRQGAAEFRQCAARSRLLEQLLQIEEREFAARIRQTLAQQEQLLQAELDNDFKTSAPSVEQPLSAAWSAAVDQQRYLADVERILEYIRAGDIYQANYTFPLVRSSSLDPIELFARLLHCNPSSHAAFLDFGEFQAISASPELFLKTQPAAEGRLKVVTRPIKGTRPRGGDTVDDRRMAEELLRSAKDQAEHVMIVDLERNDLGRVCEFGSVRVSQTLALEQLPNLYHLTSTVEGLLRPAANPLDILRATFPGGSITGAPKIRAMQILRELEAERRDVYTGAIGWLRPNGEMNFSIAIRTILRCGNRLRLGVGSGIVADSDPLEEWRECLEKGRRIAAIVDSFDE